MSNTRKASKPRNATPKAADPRDAAVHAFTPEQIQAMFAQAQPSNTVLRTKQDGFYFLAHTFDEAITLMGRQAEDEVYEVAAHDMVVFNIASSEGRRLAIKVREINCIVDVTPKPVPSNHNSGSAADINAVVNESEEAAITLLRARLAEGIPTSPYGPDGAPDGGTDAAV